MAYVAPNTGLSYNFEISPSWSFALTGGAEKAAEGIDFWLLFTGWYRRYYEDFPPTFHELLQKPTSYVEALKTLILGKLGDTILRYIPTVRLTNCNIQAESRTEYVLGLNFQYLLEEAQIQSVSFITL
jgi:hypothetical protein